MKLRCAVACRAEQNRKHTWAAAAASTDASPRGAIQEKIAVLPLQLLHAAVTAPPAAWNADAPLLGSERVFDFPRPTRVKKRAGEPCQNDMLLPCKLSDFSEKKNKAALIMHAMHLV